MCGMQMASISIWSCSCSYNGWRCSVDDGGARQVAVTVSASASYSHQQITRRSMAVLISSLPFMTSVLLSDSPALARERRNKKNIPLDQYITTQDGLKYYDLVEGKGPVAEKGSTVQVHFDCLYRGITAVSSRESKLLAGNRIIAQPYEFKVGAPPGKERKREFVDNPNGLFSAQAAPKPPPAMYTIVEGMRVGGKLTQFSPPDFTPSIRLVLRHGSESISFQHDTSPYNIPFIALWRKYTEKPTLYTVKFERPNKRTVIVPAESGYGQRGMNEIPPGATFELNVELLQIVDT